ncbi:hypothetical protein AB0B28_05950 [Glycomyces sp. NPDC046736]|uniref:hypothetical protein n=1 Tax=Glycomyces sp. NPDC046736 TaxID=3155615 RepID=UPI0033D57C69
MDAEPDNWTVLGDFTYSTGMGGHVRFIVERNTEDAALHGISSNEDLGAGPRPVAVFKHPPDGPVTWRPAWQGDPMCEAIERDARKIASG